MPPDPARPSTSEAPGSPPRPVVPAPPRSLARSRRGRRWRTGAAIGGGLIATGLLAAIAWSELHPAALAEAEAAYHRNRLDTALRAAEGHLARRPSSRSAARLVARCLSRLGRPDQAELYYRKAAPLDLEDQHVRAYALVVN